MSKDLWMRKEQSLEDKFWNKVSPEPNSGCWLWAGAVSGGGYGQLAIERKTKYAHRISYEMHVGLIPEGLEIDHLCRVRCCVNPDHLEAVTRRENILRGDGPRINKRRAATITHCPQGHPYSNDNLYIYPDGRRGCRTCLRRWAREYYRRTRCNV